MRYVNLVLVLSAVTLFGVACDNTTTVTTNTNQPSNSPVASSPAGTPDELASARINFQKNCVECHGEKGEGGTKELEGKKFKVPSLRDGHALNHTDEKFMKQISEGDDEMPAFKDKLTPEEIQGLVRFIRKDLQGK